MFWNSGKDKKKEPETATVPNTVSAPLSADDKQPKLSQIEQELNVRFGKVRSALPSGTVIQGRLSFDCAVRIDGKLGGELYSSDNLILGETAKVDATVEAKVIVILGNCSGKFKATESIEIHKGASFSGNLEAPKVRIDDGAYVKTQVTMKSSVQ